ncbi:MAG: DinB family protein [Thermomicrobiales bacterium]
MTDTVPNDETMALLAALNAQRDHVLGILDGLPEADLRRPVLPSGWTCLGLVRHLALDVERFWFRVVVAGETVDLESGAGAWLVGPDVSAGDVFALYRREIDLANAIIAATPPDADPALWPGDLFPGFPSRVLRKTILHVITETACHAGHLDAARELVDGRSWLVLTD